MNNNNLKRRRPYGHDDASSHHIDHPATYSSSDIDFSSYPLDLRRVIEQAAQIYGLSGHRLHRPACEESERKRPRMASGFPMAPHYADDDARSSPTRPSELGGDAGRHHSGLTPPFAFLDNSRIANGLETLKLWVCQKCGEENYEALPDAPSFGYATSKPYPVEKPPMMEAPSSESYGTTGLKAPAAPSFVDEAGMTSRYLQNYPSLQPQSRSVMAQPSSREPMAFASPVIPEGLSEYYGGPQAGDRSMSGADIPRSSFVTDHVMTPDHSQPQVSFNDMMSFHRPTTEVPTHGANPASRYTISAPLSYCPRESAVTDLGPGNEVTNGSQIMMYNTQARPAARRGPFKSNDEREKTAQTRKIGSCVRCRMQRIRCEINEDDATGPCLTCRKVSTNNKVWRLPCLRYKLTDVRLFKPGQVRGFEWTRRWEDTIVDNIANWASAEIRTIQVTEGYTKRSVQLRVRRFVPQEGDKLERSWVINGVRKSVAIPPFAIVDLEAARKEYTKYIDDGIFDCFSAVVKPRGGFLWKTYHLAWYMAIKDPSVPNDEKELLHLALRLWMAIRLTTKSAIIVGDETLGMSRDIMDETSPIHGCIPLPPVMGAQLDLILIHQIQTGLRRDLLDKLQKMLQANKAKTWFTTYLIMFMLLHNIALITEHDASYARKHGIKRRFAREDKVKEYHMGANILLAYFHYCNKHYHPFSNDCKDQDLRAMGELDEQKIQFVRETRKWAQDQKREWTQLRREQAYENSYYFISQLYEDSWEPQRTI